MACPFFLPERPLDSGGSTPAPRLPLIVAWAGACNATPAGPFEPREEIVRDLCNSGYARGRCAHFPDEAPADAVRFCLKTDRAGRRALIYIFEKDHAPVECGEFVEAGRDPLLARQARAFLEGHARLEKSPASR